MKTGIYIGKETAQDVSVAIIYVRITPYNTDGLQKVKGKSGNQKHIKHLSLMTHLFTFGPNQGHKSYSLMSEFIFVLLF